jgi:excisionase family DNA binding protein
MPEFPFKLSIFFTVAEVAVIFNVRKQQIYAWIEAGKVRTFQMGTEKHALRIHNRDLEKLMEAYRQGQLALLPEADEEG